MVLPVTFPAHRSRVKFYHAVIAAASLRTTATTTGALERRAFDAVSVLAQEEAAIMRQHGQGAKADKWLEGIRRVATARGNLARFGHAFRLQGLSAPEHSTQSCRNPWSLNLKEFP